MTFGREADEQASIGLLDRFAAAGGTLIDTADVYARSASEQIIGRWMSTRPASVRDQMVLATKGRFPTGTGPNDVGLTRRHLSRALEASLDRLAVDCIDLYQLHAYDPITPLDETLRFLDDATAAGKIHYMGFSNFIGWQLQAAVDVARRSNRSEPATLQLQYNLLAREVEWEMVPAAMANGLGLLPWSPLGGGWLTGKYSKQVAPLRESRLGDGLDIGPDGYERRRNTDRTWQVLSAVQDVANDRQVSMAQVSLAWLHGRPGVSSVIIGARTLEQLQDNLAATELALSDAELDRLDAASDPCPADYPYGQMGVRQRSRRIEGGHGPTARADDSLAVRVGDERLDL